MNTTENKPVCTLVTGASSGLGKELAIGFAQRHHNLVLVALPGRNLHLFCNELEITYGIIAKGYECDLTNDIERDELVRSVLLNFSVNQLVNNAGVGGSKRFSEADCNYLDKIIQLNIRATILLTHFLLPELLNHKPALIINIASMAAFCPIPYKTIYPASKAFIYSFSKSLGKELKGAGVKVIVVNPGQIITNPDVTLRIISQGFIGRLGLMTCREITSAIFSGIENGKDVIIPGLINKLNRLLIRVIPENLSISLLEKANRRELLIKNLFE
jgi:uncharacterized protein